MKRIIRIAVTIFLLVGLCATPMLAAAQTVPRQTAATDPEALQISNLSMVKEMRNLLLRMTFQNEGNIGIDEFGVAIAFVDQDGMQVYANANTLEGYTDEVSNWYYTLDEEIEAGGTYRTEDTFSGYLGVAEMVVAIRYYHQTDGDYILIPESEWVWKWSGDGSTSETPGRSYYTQPSSAVYSLCKTVNLGYLYYLLDDYNAAYYGKNQGGEWISEVTPGSLAADAGLMAGDLVLFADGVKPTENVYAVEYALAAIANGETVEWVYERDGLIYTTKMPAK
ncbi:MAG: PDZ domain-containing protein [Eubacteriales bacterium]|nr:PDZ domain-containing protein [Eubacteriales bacterium]